MVSSIKPRGELLAGQSIYSPNGQCQLVVQHDGNLVVYKNGVADWNTETNGQGDGFKLKMEFNANLYRPNGSKAWTSNVYTPVLFEEFKDRAYLVLQDDGEFGIFSDEAKWGSVQLSKPDVSPVITYIHTGTELLPGTEFIQGNYRLVFQTDGNLVIYQINPFKVIWNANTVGATRAAVQTDGNFVIYKGNQVLFQTKTATGMPAYLGFTSYGRLFLYQPSLLWTNRRGSLNKPPKVVPGYQGPLEGTPIWSWSF